MERAAWIDAIVKYLRAAGVQADDERLSAFAAARYEYLSHCEPADVAEADWIDWPDSKV